MRFHNINLSFLALIIAAASTPITFSLWASPGELRVLAQTPQARKAEAERVLQQGREQYKTSQLKAALQSFQEALIIFREIKDRMGEGKALNNLGITYNALADYTKAIEYYQQSLAIAREIKDRQTEYAALSNLGNTYDSLGDYPKAIEYHQQSLAIAREIKNRQSEGKALLNLGNAYLSLGDYKKTIEYYQQSLAIAREIKDRQTEGIALGNLGLAYRSLGDYPKAIEYHQQSLAIAREIKNRQSEGKALNNLGLAYDSLGDYPKAIDYHQQSLVIAREMKDRQTEGGALGNLGLAYRSLGDYKKAIDYNQQFLAIAREIKDRQGEGIALLNLGNAYDSLGDYPKAIEYHQQSLAIAREIKDRQTEGGALSNLGLAYLSLGDYPKAIEYHQQSLAIAREMKDRQTEGNSLGNLGLAYLSLGDYKKAIDYEQQFLAIAWEIKDRQGEGKALGNLGNAYDSLGDYKKAIDYHQQFLAIAREIKDRQGEGIALLNLGNAYDSLGDYPKAIEYHQQGLAIAQKIKDRESEGGALSNLGNAYRSLGDYPKAIEYHQQSLAIAREIKKRQSEGKALSNLGNAYGSFEDYPKAIEYHQQSLAIAREIKDRESEGKALNNLGLAYYKQGNLTLAESTLIAGIKVYESLRSQDLKDGEKVSIFETQRSIYRTLQKVLIAQNKTDAALEISERGRGRAFVELLASRLPANPKEQFPTPPNIAEIKQIAKSQNATVVEYSIIGDDFKIQGKQEGKESELYIWVIKPTGEVTFRKADLKPLWQKENTTLAQLVSTTRESLGVGDDDRNLFSKEVVNAGNENIQRASLQKLHQLLIKPIADLLPTDPNQRVTFVPQQDLFLVPFPALLDEQGKYLIEKHTVLTSPAIQVLELTRQQKQRLGAGGSIPQNALVVGNPTMPQFIAKYSEAAKELKPLPGSEKEAKAIAPILNTQALTGKEATETAIKAQVLKAKIIHFATHGLFDNFQGLQSSIALAPSASDDGFLTAEEILDLKLNADLVVLSACNTGRGKITGDGVIGLSRSLFIAGTPSVLVSLWSVPDAPTAELMAEFYQNLYTKKLDKAQALRQAMLKLKSQYPNAPKKWAAFTLIGETE